MFQRATIHLVWWCVCAAGVAVVFSVEGWEYLLALLAFPLTKLAVCTMYGMYRQREVLFVDVVVPLFVATVCLAGIIHVSMISVLGFKGVGFVRVISSVAWMTILLLPDFALSLAFIWFAQWVVRRAGST